MVAKVTEEEYHGKAAPVAAIGAKLWMMFHTFSNGHQIEPYADRNDALQHAAQIIMDYIGTDADADGCRHEERQKAREAFARDDFEGVLAAVNLHEIDDRCNVEIIESEIQ